MRLSSRRANNRVLLPLLLAVLLLTGCARVAVRGTSTLVPHFTQALFSECDPVLARESLPANLKLLEGLLRADPGNPRLLTALAMGYAGYAVLYLEEESPDRASRLLERARAFGFQALGDRGRALEAAALDAAEVEGVLRSAKAEDVKPLFWCGLAWSGWIRLNLDRPEALAQLNAAKACLERVIALDPAFFHGLPLAALGSVLAAIPPMLGGNPQEALALFERAIDENQGRFLLAKLYCARYYAVRVQDRDLFLRLLGEIDRADARGLEAVCLLNAAARQKARTLRDRVDDLFL